MTVRLFLTTVLVVAGLGVWSKLVIGWAEWADWWHDLDSARQGRMSRWRFAWMKTVSYLGTRKVRVSKNIKLPVPIFCWCTGAFALIVIGYVWPPVTGFSLSLITGIKAARWTAPEPAVIGKLRSTLSSPSLIGTDSKGQPPKVTLTGEHPAGGPQTISIVPVQGWKFWGVEAWNNIERAIEKIMPGDWEKVFESDERIDYERLPQLPDFVAYTKELRDSLKLPWHQIPVGPDGLGGWVIVDLLEYAHWMITGDNGSGKTTWMGLAGTHLTNHHDEVDTVLIDIKGFGLKRFSGRQGVVYEVLGGSDEVSEQGFAPFERAFAWLRQEVDRRKAELTKNNKFAKPLVVLWDEGEETISDAHQFGMKTPGVEHPAMVMNAMTVGRLARELDIHLIVGLQRADGTSLPTKFRAQLRGRLHFGSTDQKGAEMAVGSTDAPRLVNLEGPIGRCVAKGLNWIKTTQGLFLANPLSTKENKQARIDAEKMLTPKRTTPIPEWVYHGRPHLVEDLPVAEKPSDPSEAKERSDPSPEQSSEAPSTNGNRNGQSAEMILEQRRRKERERKAKSRAQDKDDSRNPHWEHHGTQRGWRSGCPCSACRAWGDHRVNPDDETDGQVPQ